MTSILDVLSSTRSLKTLLAVKEHAPCSKMVVVNSFGSGRKTVWNRLTDLENAGLIEVDRNPRQHQANIITLTRRGEMAVELIKGLQALDKAPGSGPCYRCRYSWQDVDGLFACTWNCPDRCIRGWHDGMYGCDHFEEAEERR